MDNLVLDTNILIDHVHGHALWLDEIITKKMFQCILPTIVVAEYHSAQQLESSEGKRAARNYLSTFRIQDLTVSIAETLGTIFRRKTFVSGASISDLIVAATAISLDAKLSTRNRAHFRGIPDLLFFDPKNQAE